MFLAATAGGALAGIGGSSFVAVDLGLEGQLALGGIARAGAVPVAGIFGHVEDFGAETESGGVVPVAGGGTAQGVAHLAAVGGIDEGAFDTQIPVLLGVHIVLSDTQRSVEQVEAAIGHDVLESSDEDISATAIDFLEDALSDVFADFGEGNAGLELGGVDGLAGAGLDDSAALAVLEVVVVVEERLEGLDLALRLVADVVLAVAQGQRNESQVEEAVGVPFLQPLLPRSHVEVIHLAPGQQTQVNSVTFSQRQVTLEGSLLDADDVDGLVFQGGDGAVQQVAGDGVRLDVVVDHIDGLVRGDPGPVEHAVHGRVLEDGLAGEADVVADIDTGSDVVAAPGQFDAHFGAQLPVELGGNVPVEGSGVEVGGDLTLPGGQHGHGDQEAEGQTHFGGDAHVDLSRHAVLQEADGERLGVVAHHLAHPLGGILLNLEQVKDAADGAHQFDVDESGGFVGRAAGRLDFIPDLLEDIEGDLAVQRLAGQTTEQGGPEFFHVVVPDVDLQRVGGEGTHLVHPAVTESNGPLLVGNPPHGGVLQDSETFGQVRSLHEGPGVRQTEGSRLSQVQSGTGLVDAAKKTQI